MAKKRKHQNDEMPPFAGFDPHPENNAEIGGIPLAAYEVDSQHKFHARITLSELRKRFGIPEHAVITVRVPGGGDWSNTDLKMGLPNGDGEFEEIAVTWEETEVHRP